ncbi:hypothetical protein JOL79_07040 [Microbispora sp. RL4-1S]|uniref:Uncharacterized protein n=1 Tax=Microbispora oryzae TaxID=2806554 RepID=A0A940WMW5_9ACTN|nr:hypothetical protein [Microbispora oryzae]MBP2703554.1 hypothetical protein [Microbispora oryzae]
MESLAAVPPDEGAFPKAAQSDPGPDVERLYRERFGDPVDLERELFRSAPLAPIPEFEALDHLHRLVAARDGHSACPHCWQAERQVRTAGRDCTHYRGI